MTYATLARVQAMVSTFTIDATSKPTADQVTLMLSDTSAEIDAVLSGVGVTVPCTTPTWFLNSLALLNAYGTAAMVLKSAYPEASGPGENPAYSFWESRYRAGLKLLGSGSGLPSESVGGASGSGVPSSYFTRNPDEEEELGLLEGAHMFTVAKEF